MGELERQQAEKGQLWLSSLSDADLLRLVERQRGLRASSGDPGRGLTEAEAAETLGLRLEDLTAQIRAAGGTP